MGFLKVSKWIFSTLLAGVTARSRLGGKNNRQVILAKEPHADRAARSILIGFGSFKGSDDFPSQWDFLKFQNGFSRRCWQG